MKLYIDGDACPVKDETIRVAERHQLPVILVSNRWHRIDHYLVSQQVVSPDPDAADHVIAGQVECGDVVITGDIPLAARCLEKGAFPIDSRGRLFTTDSIGMQLAMRNLMQDLRDRGEVSGGPSAYGRQDRSRFLDGLERQIQSAKRGQR